MFGRSFGRLLAAAVILAISAAMVLLTSSAAGAAGYVPISGSGSIGVENALDQWRRDVNSSFGITVNYSGNGSTSGRNDFRAGQVDFAVSEVPYGLTDSGVLDPAPSRAFGYMPIVADGTAFVYNIKIGNYRVTNLRLSGENLTKIFTKVITNWSDPAIAADNPGLNLPNRTIVPVVRSDGAGTTAEFTAWMANQYSALWDDYCHRTGRNITPCGFTSFYPTTNDMVSKAQSQGVAGFVAQDSSEGAITYVEYSYGRNSGMPVVKMLNAANYYVAPTAGNLAVALLNAKLRPDLTADLSLVYNNPDPRTYPLSSYTYMIVPQDTTANFNTEKGQTLSEFAAYALCEGQQKADSLGYSPLPINLVQAAINQINQVPGSTHKLDPNNLAPCNNPTVSPTGGNLLAENAPQPSECDHKGHIRCTINPGEDVSTTVTASPPSPVVEGTAVTLTAAVTPSDVDGSVQFWDGSTNIGALAHVIGGVASITLMLPVGSHQLSATFTPAVSGVGYASPLQTVTYVVNPSTPTPSPILPPTPSPTSPPPPAGVKQTTTTLLASPNPGFRFFPEILIARVSPFNAVGTVQFFDENKPLGNPTPVTAGFTLSVKSLPKGTHSLTAVFIPANQAAYALSTSSPIPLTVDSLF